MAYTVMAYSVMAYTANIVVAYVVMANNSYGQYGELRSDRHRLSAFAVGGLLRQGKARAYAERGGLPKRRAALNRRL